MNIILYGLRGTGKTKIGKALAKKLKREFIDIDDMRLYMFRKTVDQAVSAGGWPLFRKQEKEVVLHIAKHIDNAVVAAGGGTMMDAESAAILKENGKTVLLSASIETMLRRVLRDEARKYNSRPSLTQEKDPRKEMEEVINQRQGIYLELADLVIDTSKLGTKKPIEAVIKKFDL